MPLGIQENALCILHAFVKAHCVPAWLKRSPVLPEPPRPKSQNIMEVMLQEAE